MRDTLPATLRALAFLTRLPPVAAAFDGPRRLGDDVHAFPLAGLVAALPPALLLAAALSAGLSPLAAATLAIMLAVAVTGGLHEDGLGDVADGLGGHHEGAKAIAIMKDSRIGSYGALALILSLMARIVFLGEIADHGATSGALALLAVAAGSRGAMGWLWSSLPSADPRGLAQSVGQPRPRTGRIALALGGGIAVLLGALAAGPLGALLPGLFGLLALGQFRRLLIRRLGGQTGDTLGAAQQIVEIAALLGFAIAV